MFDSEKKRVKYLIKKSLIYTKSDKPECLKVKKFILEFPGHHNSNSLIRINEPFFI